VNFKLKNKNLNFDQYKYREYYRSVLDVGFVEIHKHLIIDKASKENNIYRIFFCDGVFLTLESYGGYSQDCVNSANIYYNWRPNRVENKKDESLLYAVTKSGHWRRPDGKDISWDKFVWIGSCDVRSGLGYTLEEHLKVGKFIWPWIEFPFIWFVDYSQTKGDNNDLREIGKKADIITKNVIETFPEQIKIDLKISEITDRLTRKRR